MNAPTTMITQSSWSICLLLKRPGVTAGPSFSDANSAVVVARVVTLAGGLAGLILRASPGVLELAFGLVSLAFALHFLVAEQLPGAFLHLAAHLLGAAFDAIVVDPGGRAVVVLVMVVHGFPP